MNTKNDYTVQSVQKTLRLLKLFNSKFSEPSKPLTLMEICALTGYPASTATRFLFTLQQEGFIKFDPETKKYSPDIVLFQLGMSMFNAIDVPKIALPHLNNLARQSGLVVYLAMVTTGDVIVVEKVLPPNSNTWSYTPSSQVGFAFPMHSAGISRLYLGEHSDEEIREILSRQELVKYTRHTVTDVEEIIKIARKAKEEGLGYCDSENEDYMGSICAPIRDYSGQMIAGVSIAGIRDVIYGEKQPEYTRQLLDVTTQIMRELGA